MRSGAIYGKVQAWPSPIQRTHPRSSTRRSSSWATGAARCCPGSAGSYAVPEVVEEIKWRKASNPLGVPVWSHEGIIVTGETYKDKVKLTFANGASLDDPAGLFNSSLEGNVRRAIDLQEGDTLDEDA